MIFFTPQCSFFFETILFVSVIFMHLVRKNFTLVFLYVIQSLIITITLFYSSFKELSLLFIIVAMLTFLVKVVIAPYFFLKLIKKDRLQFSASTYLNSPMTLVVLALLTVFSYSRFFRPLTILAPNNENALLLGLAMIFISIFLIINRKGVLSQVVGILSLENAIVSFASLAGLETAAGPQIGILFDLLVWIITATIFVSMIYQHFGSIDVSKMERLKEE